MDGLDYAAFLADIERREILVPLDIDAAGVVLDGHQRLRAALELGHETVPIREVRVEDPVAYMLLAAIRRRNLDASQKAALQLQLIEYEHERAAGKARSRANLRNSGVEVATLPPRAGKLRDWLAHEAGVSARTAQDVLTTYEADPALFEQIRTGTVPAHRAAQLVRRERRYAEIGEGGPLPAGPFDLVYTDPPWQMGNAGSDSAPEAHYRTRPTAEIADQPPPTGEHAVLYLWAVTSMLEDALEVMRAWGFAYKSQQVWVKPSIKLGVYFRNRHELLLFGRKGNYPVPEPDKRVDSVIEAPCGRHSAKPEIFYELIERSYPRASKLELYHRGKPRPGWTTWGNESQT
jgi:N6-adenosine-specific RNA methylase IME4